MRQKPYHTVRDVRRALRRPVVDVRTRLPRALGGWEVGPPDFVGVGVQRSGTSWWHRLLDHHPDVHAQGSFAKEQHFFDRFWTGEFGSAEIDEYHRRFARPVTKRCGEWTPRYMFDPWTPPLLRQAAPDARVLVLLRDPLERLRSGVTHAAERGRDVDETVVATAVARGFYHHQLTHLLRSFPREQVLVLQLERCVTDPSGMLERTLGFLGLRTDVDLVSALAAQVNTRKGEPLALSKALVDAVVAEYEPDVRRLGTEFPEIDIALWRNFAHLA